MAANELWHPDSVQQLLPDSSAASNMSVPVGTAGRPSPGSRGCENGALMGNFGMFIQGLLGVVAFSLLMLKRFREPKYERRPWKICGLVQLSGLLSHFRGTSRVNYIIVGLESHVGQTRFLDTSKQAIGMLFIHFANVYLSDLTEEDPCSLYLINFLLDATMGMLLIYAGVRIVGVLVEWRHWESLRFGEYGDPLECSAWVGQCALYLLIMMLEKTVVIVVLLLPQWKKVALLNPIQNPQLELAIVMLIVPFFVNILISADDEMDESEGDEDLRRLMNLKPVKKKLRFGGLPV
ncbi:store-operated calcium entry regulator STIMATE isoform X3 [Heterodontus francisci]|uniref:store-operated calcium entry regulator STIMATE isoform X3 n=1 Tax=Heterodontus francisci TaxID=7792 RepID=UPI00355C1A51